MSAEAPKCDTVAATQDFLHSEFLAENEIVTILPSTHIDEIDLISGTYGPFEPAIEEAVPLYLALTLKKQKRARLVPPDFLSLHNLRAIREAEMSPVNKSKLTKLHFHFAELGSLILHYAADDLREPPLEIRAVLEDIMNTRESKIRKFTQTSVRTRTNAVRLANLTAIEISQMRRTFVSALETFYKIGEAAKMQEEASQVVSSQAPGSTGTATQETPVVRRRIR